MIRPRSIEWKLPWAISTLLLVVLGALCWIAYLDVRRTVRSAAAERLMNLTRQFTDLLQPEAAAAGVSLRSAARSDTLVALLRRPIAPDTAALAALWSRRPQAARIAAIEIHDLEGRIVYRTGRPAPDIVSEGFSPRAWMQDSSTVGPFMAVGDTVMLPTVARIDDGTRPLGFIVEWRMVTGDPAERDQTTALIGPGSALFLGSPSTGVWTDRVGVVPPPPVDVSSTDSVVSYERAGMGRRLAAAGRVGQAPWWVLIEFSEDAVLAPAARFLLRVSIIALVLFIVGLISIWLVVRRLTIPLRQLTTAAEGITGGDYSGRVDVHRDDEIGRLAASFNAMAQRVEDSHRELQGTVDELRMAREQFAHAQRMEAVGRLAGGVAHDFNNILTVILGEAELALNSPVIGRESLEEIQRAGERAAALTRQLLAFSRRQLIEPTVFDLNELVVDLEKMLARLIGENVRMTTQLAATLPAVRADRGQIEQVIVNLAVNARDAMPEGGRLTIETRIVQLDAAYAESRDDVVPGDYVAISVSDTGTGMSEEVQSHLFEPFFTTKDRGKGTGLGLATCYGIVKQSGGHITAYSELGVGTTMRAYLPLVTAEPEQIASREVSPPGGNEVILLVEDDAGVRGTTARILTATGYQVLEAADGFEALRLVEERAGPIDLILTDVVLPGLGGRQLAERIAEIRPGIRVLFVSGYTDDVILQHQLVARDVFMLQKPFSSIGLSRKVREVLDRP